jgi:beta-lactamase regulating signal transducer with metallopeptidase domain
MSFLSNSEVSLAFLAACSLKATFLIVIAWFLSTALRRQPAALRHLVWTVAILSALVLPLLASLLPAWHSAALGNASRLWTPTLALPGNAASQSLPTTIVDAVAASPSLNKVADVFLLIWFAGFLFVLFRLILGLFLLARISSRAVPLTTQSWIDHVAERSRSLGIDLPVPIFLSSNARSMPLTWGVFRAPILLPAGAGQWSEDRLRIVFAHELAHIARRDWLWQVLAELSCAVYWFHPLAWLAAARLRRESECACDDSVLNSGIDASQYAFHLLDLAKNLNPAAGAWSAALAFARRSNLERRFSAMLNSSIDRGN